MALGYKTRRRLALAILLIGLPVYVIVAVLVVSSFERPSIWLELMVYVVLGVVWVWPLKAIFMGVGREDPDAED